MKKKRFIVSVLLVLVMTILSAEIVKVKEIKKCEMWQAYTGETYDETMKVLGDTITMHWTKDSKIRIDECETTIRLRAKNMDQSKIEKIVRNEKKHKKYCILVTNDINDMAFSDDIRYVFEDDISKLVKGYGSATMLLRIIPSRLTEVIIYYVEADNNFQVWIK